VLLIDSATLKMLKEYVRRGGPILRNGKKLIFGVNRHRAWQIVKECAEKTEAVAEAEKDNAVAEAEAVVKEAKPKPKRKGKAKEPVAVA